MKEHKLELDKPRELRYGFRALRDIRLRVGERSLENLMNMPVDEMPVFAWAGLKWEDKTLTVEQVEELLDAAIPDKYTVMEVTEIIITAMADQIGIETKKTPAGETKVHPDLQKAVEETVKTGKIMEEKKAQKKKPEGTTISSKKQKKQP